MSVSQTIWAPGQYAALPPPRWFASTAYDLVAECTLLFGGVGPLDAPGVYNDTWAGTVTGWTETADPNPPPARGGASMAFDPTWPPVHVGDQPGGIVLFGGFDTNGLPLGDTWEWRDFWMNRSGAADPPARAGAAMASSAARATVLFGGESGSTNGRQATFFNDTWEWASGWGQLSPAASPPARTGATMAADVTGNLVLFGGGDYSAFNDTWVWDGTTWTQCSPAVSPPARMYAVMMYDAARQLTVLFGGCDENGAPLNDTWVWDGVNWTQQVVVVSPPGGGYGAMAYDSAAATGVLFTTETLPQRAGDPTTGTVFVPQPAVPQVWFYT